ncbi:MAG: hypothetical protein EB060_11245 [Proteobacteria bacterium]|nr:hypothetical protein [Pseudomonadota bacterium]
MFNLLPRTNQKEVLFEYRLRVASACLTAFAVLVFLAGVSLIPSYVSSINQAKLFQTQYDSVHAVAGQKVDTTLVKLLSATKGKLDLSGSYLSVSTASSMVSRVISHQSDGIRLTAFRFGADEVVGGVHQRKITVTGQAVDRLSLLHFYQSLQAEKKFQAVVLPVPDFQSAANIDFNISFISLM